LERAHQRHKLLLQTLTFQSFNWFLGGATLNIAKTTQYSSPLELTRLHKQPDNSEEFNDMYPEPFVSSSKTDFNYVKVKLNKTHELLPVHETGKTFKDV